MRAKTVILNFCLFLGIVLLFPGCDQTFQPLQKNDKYYFSIYGYLDAAADTQWIRVGPARKDINEPPDPTGIIVTLEHVQSGETVTMKDSLFSPKSFLNYWTTLNIANEQTYRIVATGPSGKASQVTVTIPEELPTPLVWLNEVPPGYNIYIDDSVEHVADLQTKWYVILNPQTDRLKRTYTFSYRNKLKHTGAFGGAYFTLVQTTEELRYIVESNASAEMAVLDRQFFVAAGGPEWDDNISSVTDLEYFLDGTGSNVESGLGYVVGIDSKWVPYSRQFQCYPL